MWNLPLPKSLLILVNRSNYCAAKSTFLDIWSDSQMRDWLVEHKYLDDRTAGQKQRDELAELIKQRYSHVSTPPFRF